MSAATQNLELPSIVPLKKMSTSWIFDQTFFWVPVLLIRDSRVPQKFDVYHTNLTCSMPWGVSFYWTETSQWKQRVWFGSSKLIFDLQIRCDRPCFSGFLECNTVLASKKKRQAFTFVPPSGQGFSVDSPPGDGGRGFPGACARELDLAADASHVLGLRAGHERRRVLHHNLHHAGFATSALQQKNVKNGKSKYGKA